MNVEMIADKFIKKRVNLEDAHDKAEEACDDSVDAKGVKFIFAKKLCIFGI